MINCLIIQFPIAVPLLLTFILALHFLLHLIAQTLPEQILQHIYDSFVTFPAAVTTDYLKRLICPAFVFLVCVCRFLW